MLLTYIVTTYNLTAAQIERCLRSLLVQGLPDREAYEVLVVDDASAVSPQPIVEAFADRMNVRFFTQPHARQGAARNLAFRHAQGEYIQIVDGDDYLLPDSMRPILDTLQRHQLDMLIYRFCTVTEGEKAKVHASDTDDHPTILSGQEYMRRHTLFGSSCTMCFRRGLLQLDTDHPILFPEGICIEDEEFVTRLVWQTPRLATSHRTAYAYVTRADSTTRSRSATQVEQRYADTFTVLDHLLDYRASLPADMPADGLDRKLHFLAVDILRHALREPYWQERFETCAEALRTRQLAGQPFFPLPAARWSAQYILFRLLATHRWGQHILHRYEQRTAL